MIITAEIAKYRYLIDRYNKVPDILLYMTGPEGTGKSIFLQNLFLNKKNIKSHTISFRTPPPTGALFDEIFSKMETYRKKVVLPKNQYDETRIVIDDISMDTNITSLDFIRNLQ